MEEFHNKKKVCDFDVMAIMMVIIVEEIWDYCVYVELNFDICEHIGQTKLRIFCLFASVLFPLYPTMVPVICTCMWNTINLHSGDVWSILTFSDVSLECSNKEFFILFSIRYFPFFYTLPSIFPPMQSSEAYYLVCFRITDIASLAGNVHTNLVSFSPNASDGFEKKRSQNI